MNLHKNKELFEIVIKQVADAKKMDEETIKKDYYVTLLLKEIAKKNNDIIFKGGTSLSKSWHLINRFSEDLDLTCEIHPTVGERKNISNIIIDAVKNCELRIDKEEEIKNRADYNKYEIYYDIEKRDFLKENIVVETTYFIESFPSVIKTVSSYIYEHYRLIKNEKLIEEYELYPFEIRVQSLERTFIDKVFAICDYYIRKTYDRNSRHIYDLYKIYPHLKFDENFKELLEKVRLLRRKRSYCESAQEEIKINDILKDIVKTKIFKNDYEKTTMKMFSSNEDISYDEAIIVINRIIDDNMF